jgi:hypothetical protein
MACPHSSAPGSTAATCSLCRQASGDQAARPKAITRDPDTGQLLIDGVPKEGDDYTTPAYGRTVPRKRRGGQSPAVKALRLVEPEPVDELDDD